MTTWRFQVPIAALLGAITAVGQPIPPNRVDDFTGNPRVVVISDIGNEPDDQMSLVRLLLYSNEIDIEALVAATSTWQKTAVHPETMLRAHPSVWRGAAASPAPRTRLAIGKGIGGLGCQRPVGLRHGGDGIGQNVARSGSDYPGGRPTGSPAAVGDDLGRGEYPGPGAYSCASYPLRARTGPLCREASRVLDFRSG